MQNKGKLAALLSSVIAVLLILVCAFYLSFTIVNSNYETAATDYAHVQSQGKENQDQAYNDAYKHYMDSIGQQKVYLGYTLDEVRKWGVNLGLDLKGGMNVTLQVDMPDMMRQLANVKNDSNFEKALTATSAFMDKEPNADYLQHFLAEYAKVCPNADLTVVFSPVVKENKPDVARSQLRAEIRDMVNTSATQTLRKRIDQFGVVSPNIQVLEGKDGQILLESPASRTTNAYANYSNARPTLSSTSHILPAKSLPTSTPLHKPPSRTASKTPQHSHKYLPQARV